MIPVLPSRNVRGGTIEPLETRIAPAATLDVLAGTVTFAAGSGTSNLLTLSIAGPNYVFNDTGEPITLGAGAIAAGFTGGGTNTVSGPNTAVSALNLQFGDQDDTLQITALTDPLIADGQAGAGDAISIVGTVNPGGALTLTAESVVVNGGVSGATAVTFTADEMAINSPVVASGRVILQPLTAARPINLGVETAGSLSLTDAELDRFTTPGVLQAGSTAAGPLTIGAAISPLNVGGALSLFSGAGIGGQAIAVAALRVNAGGGSVLLTAANDVDTFAGSSTADITLIVPDDLGIGTVDGVAGLSATGTISLSANNTTQTSGANIVSTALALTGAGPYVLNGPGNDVETLAANVSSSVLWFDADAFSVGSVAGTNGVVSTNSDVFLLTINGDLTVLDTCAGADVVSGASSAVNFRVQNNTLQERALNITANAGITGGINGVTLKADVIAIGAAVNAGAAVVNILPISSGRDVDLGSETTGKLSLTDAEIDFVTTTGVLRIGDNILTRDLDVTAPIGAANVSTLALLATGVITDQPGGSISETNVRLLGDGGITLDNAHAIGTLAAVTTTTAGGFFYSNGTTPLTIGTVDGVSGMNVAGSFLTLHADTLDIQQDMTVSGRAVIRPATAGRQINLGTATGALDLTDAELDHITAGTLAIGTLASTGAINLSSAISPANATTLALRGASVGGAGTVAVTNLAAEVMDSATLNNANDVDVFAASNVNPIQIIVLADTDEFSIGTVDGVTGITAPASNVTVVLDGGPVTQSAGARVLAPTLVPAGAGPYTLNDPANDITTFNSNSAGAVHYTDANDFVFSTQTISQLLDLTTPGAVTQAGVLSGAGALTFNGPGTLTLDLANTYAGATTLTGGTLKGNGVPGVLAITGGTLAPGASPGTFTAGNTTFNAGSAFAVEINGLTAGTQYDQLAVTGTVNLGGATLTGTTGFTPVVGNQFVIISNDGADAVAGTFAGLAEGATVTLGTRNYRISYAGGTGNDVVLTALRLPTTLTWQGDVNANWNGGTPGVNTNWTDGTSQVVPQDGDSLVFPAGAGNLTNTNDIAGLDLAAITLSGLGYVIDGNAITLSGGLTVSAAAGVGNAPAFLVDITLAGDQAINIIGSGAVVLTGTIAVGGHTLTVTGAGTGALVIGGAVTGAGSVVKDGACIFVFNGTQTAGTLTLTAGVLGGVGTTGPLTATGGTVAPGAGAGILSSGNATFAAGSTFSVELEGTTAGTSHDQLSVTGTVNLGGATLATTLGYTPVLNDTLTIIANDGADAVTGTFAGLPQGAIVLAGASAFRISYTGGDGNDVVLTGAPRLNVTLSKNLKTATFTDRDGDSVTIKTSAKTGFEQDDFRIFAGGTLGGGDLTLINLSDDGTDFAKASLTVTSKKPKNGTGDGFVKVDFLNAAGIDLGNVTIDGTLGEIDAGTVAVDPKVAALKGLTVQTLGSGASDLVGRLGKLSVKGNVEGATLIASEGIGGVTIKGSWLGGQLRSGADIGAVSVTGSITGTDTAPVIISAFGKATAPTKGLDLAIKSLKVGVDVERLRVLAGYNTALAGANADAAIGAITVGKDWKASTVLAGVTAGTDGLEGTADDKKIIGGRDNTLAPIFSQIASITIKGAASGTAAAGDSFGIIAEQIGEAKIGATVLAFTKGARNAADFFPIAGTTDFAIGESTAV